MMSRLLVTVAILCILQTHPIYADKIIIGNGADTSTTVKITWTGYSNYINATVYLGNIDEADIDIMIDGEYTFTGLSPGVSYNITVRGFSTDVDDYQTIQGPTAVATSPASPVNLGPKSVTTSSILMSWETMPSSHQDAFTLQYFDVEKPNMIRKVSNIIPTSTVEQNIPRLLSGRNYSISVWAQKSMRRMSNLKSETVTVFVNTMPYPPIFESLVAVNTTHLKATYRGNEDSTQDRYKVIYQLSTGTQDTVAHECQTQLTCVFDVSSQGLPGSGYLVTVSSVSGGIESQGVELTQNTRPIKPGPLELNTDIGRSAEAINLWSTVPKGTVVTGPRGDVLPSSVKMTISNLDTKYQIALQGMTAGTRCTVEFYTYSGNVTSEKVRGFFYSKPPNPPPPSQDSAGTTTSSLKVTWTPPNEGEFTKYLLSIEGVDAKEILKEGNREAEFLELIPGATYRVDLETEIGSDSDDAGKVQSDKSSTNMTTKPMQPQDVSLTGENSENSLKVTWKEPGQGMFEKFLARLTSNTADFKTVQKGSTYEATFSSLAAGTEYTVEVLSQSKDQNSAPAVGKFHTKPNPPNSLVHTTVTNETILVSWVQPSEGGFEKYEIKISPENTPIVLNSDVTAHNFTNLASATLYTITIVSTISGVSSTEQVIKVITKPNPPTALTEVSATRTELQYSWTKPSGPDISQYRILLKKGNDIIERFSTVDSITINGLTPGATYDIEIFSQMEETASVFVSGKAAASKVTMLPNSISTLKLKGEQGRSYIEVEWGAPTDDYSGFTLSINPDVGGSVTKSNTDLFHKFNNLAPGVKYTISIRTVSQTKLSEESKIEVITKPTSVAELAIDEVAENSVKVSWQPPADETTLTGYALTISPNHGGLASLPLNLPTETSTYTFASLRPGEAYTIAIQVISGGVSSENIQQKVNTNPLPVTQLETRSAQMDSFVVSWNAASNSKQDKFVIAYSDGSNKLLKDVDATFSSTYSTTIDNLVAGNNYFVNVTSKSGDSFSSINTVNQTTRPRQVINLDVAVNGPTGIDVSWEPSSTSTQDAYGISYMSEGASAGSSGWTPYSFIDQTNQAYTSFFPGNKYTFKVIAKSNDEISEEITGWNVTNPLPPPGLTVDTSATTTSSVLVRWDYDPSKTHATGFKVYQTQSGTADRNLDVTTYNTNDRERKVSNLQPGYNYTIEIYSMTLDNIESLNASSAEATVKPVISTTIQEVTAETTNDTVVINYTASISGTFDKYEFTIKRTGSDTTESSIKDASDNDRTVRFTQLIAGTQYEITGITISGGVKSDPTPTFYILTKPNPPDVACVSQKRAITLNLTRALGQVSSYTVECTGSPECNTPQTVYTNDFDRVTFNYLTPFKDYTFKVTSQRREGANTKTSIVRTTICSTSQAAPEAPLSFNYTEFKPYEVKFKWDEPAISNGVLTGYKISFRGTRQDYDNHESEVVIDNPNTKETTVDGLIAGHSYMFWIAARTVDYGAKSNTSLSLPVEAPFKQQSLIQQSQPHVLNVSHDWFEINLVNPFLPLNGAIVGYSVIVSQRSIQPFDGDITTSYEEASNQEPMPPYAAIHRCSSLFVTGNQCWGFDGVLSRRRRQTDDSIQQEPESVVIRIGGDAHCDFRSADGYCNGPLRPATTHYVLVRAYTENGLYSDTPISRPIQTDKPLVRPVPLEVIIAVVVVLVVLAVVVAVVVVLFRRGIICSDEKGDDYEFDSPYESRRGSSWSYSNAVSKRDFPAHVKKMSADCDFRFAEEFESLKPVGVDAPHRESERDENRLKNRFTNILPYDHSRIKMLPVDDEEGSDYINANWMPGYNSKREFIVTQGPLPGTKDDFWRMLWEHNASAIVMLTACVEKGRDKCDHYWPPDSEPMFYGDLQVVILNETKAPYWVITEMKVSKGQQSRKIRHFHFTVWKDFGVPPPEVGPGGLVKFVRLVRETIGNDHSPIIVHCSAGVGRSGTYIVVDNLLQRIKEHDTIDVLATVYEMRKHRCYMVQTEQQYIYIHECLQYVLEGNENTDDTYISGEVNSAYEVSGSVDTVADMFFQLAPRQALSSDEDDGLTDEGIAEH